MIPMIIAGVFRVKDAVEEIPIQAMMVVVPMAILAVATVAAVIARYLDRWLSHDAH